MVGTSRSVPAWPLDGSMDTGWGHMGPPVDSVRLPEKSG